MHFFIPDTSGERRRGCEGGEREARKSASQEGFNSIFSLANCFFPFLLGREGAAAVLKHELARRNVLF